MFEQYPEIVTVDEVCEMLQFGKSAVYEILRNGSLRSIRNGKKYVIPRIAVEDFVRKQLYS